MLPISAWPPGAPGSSLSPFGSPWTVNAATSPTGFILPKGKWIVQTGGNQVVMRVPSVTWGGPPVAPGTGLLPGTGVPPPQPPPGLPPPVGPWTPALKSNCPGPQPWQWPKYLDFLMAWRAWQRQVGRTDPPIRPLPGRRPPNWFGWFPAAGQVLTLLGPGQSGQVTADGQNVAIAGGGCSTVIQVF
jgi:hypothetical protein